VNEVLSIGAWRTNAELIRDVARLPGYLTPPNADDAPWSVLDATYGIAGGFWKKYRPANLVTNDLHAPADHHWDFRTIPVDDGTFDVVVLDPDYKLNGTPALGEQDVRYGTDENLNREERLEKIKRGTIECYRVCRRRLFVKCMDQVEGGRKRWQTDLVTRAVEELGGRKLDRFDIPLAGRAQPTDRLCPECSGSELPSPCWKCHGTSRIPIVQRTSRSHHSSLLVFEKPRSNVRS
jgi:hypothetical protein